MNKSILFAKIKKVILLSLFILFALQTIGQETEKAEYPKSIKELQSEIEKVLEETNTPAVGIALVNKEGPVWIAGLGIADVENNKDADENTMFRIGSTSKMYVSLSILKLQEEGKLSLKDKVRDLIPEIEFENPWKDTNPILIEHLLEHTTGWDDIHLPEYAHNDPTPITLKDGLDFHPHSRESRWIPGTRMSYCNAGPPVAAYIVEKITGLKYEDYVRENFFGPMGMENMTFFKSEAYDKHGAKLYLDGISQDYWHIIARPSGSINASPKDMANMVYFFINRCSIDSVQIISEESLKRMETPVSTSGAQAGLEYGYGLSNYSTPFKNFVYRSHNGGVNGGLTDFSYLPEHNVGYAVMINSGSGTALRRIIELIRGFQTKDFGEKEIKYDVSDNKNKESISAYYSPINPRMKMSYFLERIFEVQKIWQVGDTIYRKGIFGGNAEKYLHARENRYLSPETGKISMVKTSDPLAGEVIDANGQVFKPVSPIMVYGQLVIGGLWILFIVSAILVGIIWLILFFIGKISKGAHIWVRMWPSITSLTLILSVVVLFLGMSNPFETLGKASFISVMLMVFTICYALSSAFSVANVIKIRKSGVNRVVYWYSSISAVIHFTVTCYLLLHGVIGLQSWA